MRTKTVISVDIHAHILPGADHGSRNLETSLRQLQMASGAGISTIVATPHFYPGRDTVERFVLRRQRAFDELRAAAPGVNILRAAEAALEPGMERMEGLEELCIEGTDYILLELPGEPWMPQIYDTVYRIAAQRRLRPILAHIDRYSEKSLRPLLEMNVTAQANAEGIVRWKTRRRMKKLIAEGKLHLLGSDAHGEAKEYAAFASAVRILDGNSGVSAYFGENAQAVVSNSEIRRLSP